MLNLTETEKAYLAGLFDGEGCIGLYKDKRNYVVHISITNTDIRLITWLQQHLCMGNIQTRSVVDKPEYHQAWEWRTRSRKDALAFLLIIRPFLVSKAEQADLLLSYLDAAQKSPQKSGVRSPETFIDLGADAANELKQLKLVGKQSVH